MCLEVIIFDLSTTGKSKRSNKLMSNIHERPILTNEVTPAV